MRDVKVAIMIVEVVVKFKESEEFTTRLKKEYHNGYDVRVVEICYNIWVKYRDFDYSFLEGELTNLIGEWLEAEKLNALDPTPSSPPPSPLAEGIIGARIMPIGAFKQQPAANADEEAVASNPPPTVEEPVGEVTSRVVSSKTLIDLKEEHVIIADTDLPT